MCDRGFQKQANEWGACHFGGHDCWERIVEPQAREVAVHLSPLTLHEAIGYLDAVWRDVFGKKPLLAGGLLTAGGMLAEPCATVHDFNERVKGLVDVFDAFQVPGGKAGRPLESMLDFLKSWAESREAAKADLPSVEEAISVIRSVANVRAYFQHSDARARTAFEAAQRALRIRLPAVSYAEEWDRLVARVTEMLRVLREFLRKHA